jgi:two-component system, OmpR family, response regulator RegX3
MRIAILEDDPSQMELLVHWLQLAGHHAHAFERGAQLLRALELDSFDALLLDWNIPDISGLEVLKRVRQQLRSRIPIVFITARTDEVDVVLALRQGADGYLVKPMRRMELLARLQAVTRRDAAAEASQAQQLEVDAFRVDVAARRLLRNDQPLDLSAKDFDLAVFFLRNVGRLLSRGHLMESVWSAKAAVSSRTLDTHVSRIRNKLLLMPEHGWRLAAVYGYGYRLERLAKGTALRAPQAASATKDTKQPAFQDLVGQEA